MSWIQHPVVLEGEKVKLVPLDADHFHDLLQIGGQEKIWEHISINGADQNILVTHLRSALLKRATGEQYPFTVIDKLQNNIIGSTLFHNIFPQHHKLEIGWTWYDPIYWRTGYNRECKLLLLTYAFETLKAVRVQLVTDATNFRSRTAIEGIGATFEGELRKERIRANGAYRNTAMYSIIDDEWPKVKKTLQQKLAAY
ncbi:N-acetyltransferase [Flavipsychrobacter stenotrophus]|uniref:N-acetyltransferase n=1 Tax=Flavipsychrobacter stenotrophus TaxID=2077091 RepID=A0A2S7STD5_9BACT|nr:GNAT family protein [Flavipsychrobacter stenotrophus]PQJ10199.1 N-acetyltransferase [Flavipsychrobacter stenotrophus]